jgi:copper homeostasis protein
MNKKLLLEICVETPGTALAAERGGADRIELCEDLRAGGVTPGVELMRAVRAEVEIPVFTMIRPREGDFCYSAAEFEQMKKEVGIAKACGMDGVVFGVLKQDGTVDVQRNSELVSLAKPLPVTFHRAFDETPNLLESLEDVIATGAARILTSGGAATAEKGAARLSELVMLAGGRVTILAGGGINPANLRSLWRSTGAQEFHSGLTSARPRPRLGNGEFESEVRRLAEVLKEQGLAGNIRTESK